MTTRTWQLAWTSEPERPAAAVLVLHGGQERSRRRARWRHVAALRMVPLARAVAVGGEGQVAVARLLHTVRGWNGDEASPVVDAREALAELRNRHPGIPLGLLGHSMGGRTALYLADEPGVAVVVGLAPWVARGDLPRGGPGLRVLLMHGTRDRITSPKATLWMARELGTLGVDVTWRPIPGAGHTLLRFARRWHREAAAFLVQGLLGAPPDRSHAEDTTPRDKEPDATNCA